MKIRFSLFSLFCFFLIVGLVSSCEGDQGPAGEIGQVGPQGPEGPEGPEGMGFQDCAACHQTQKIASKVFQWEHSTHATGGNFTRSNSSCAGCHTSQGFLQRVDAATATVVSQNASANVDEPLPQNCYTCHQIHRTFSEDDWALNVTPDEDVMLWATNEKVNAGTGNVCISCHQARTESPALPQPGATGTFTITNKRYGPHHGAQGVMFFGSGAYKVGTGYANSPHTTLIENACVTCHMASLDGLEAGGHTFNVSNEDGDINTAGCISCHDNLSTPLADYIENTQTEVADLLAELEQKLIDKGILNPNDLPYANASNSNPLILTADELGALYNYQYVREDQSLGIHNAKFAKTLLINSIAALN